MPLLLLFLDGVGLGEPDPAFNPFTASPTPTLRDLLGGPLVQNGVVDREGILLVSADATLGVPGLPQSATGQTALLTGLNAPALVGHHVTAYPTPSLRALLAEDNLLVRAAAAGRSVALANAYTSEYHAAVGSGRLRHGAITLAALGADVRLRGVDDLRRGEAVFHDLTNRRLRSWGHDVPLRTPQEAGRTLARVAGAHDLTLFEFFLTDLSAHGRTDETPAEVVEMIDALLGGVVDALPPSATLLLTSDHGNLEDLRTRGHTRNPVPVLAVGPQRHRFASVEAITDVAPAVLRALDVA